MTRLCSVKRNPVSGDGCIAYQDISNLGPISHFSRKVRNRFSTASNLHTDHLIGIRK